MSQLLFQIICFLDLYYLLNLWVRSHNQVLNHWFYDTCDTQQIEQNFQGLSNVHFQELTIFIYFYFAELFDTAASCNGRPDEVEHGRIPCSTAIHDGQPWCSNAGRPKYYATNHCYVPIRSNQWKATMKKQQKSLNEWS